MRLEALGALLGLVACNSQFDFDTERWPPDAAQGAARDAETAPDANVGDTVDTDGTSSDDAIGSNRDAASPSEEGATPGDADKMESSDAASQPEAAVHVARVLCGDSSCDLPSKVCCASDAKVQCVDQGNACSGSGVTIECDEASDCPQGKVCCAEVRSGRVTAVSCADRDACPLSGHAMLCDPKEPSSCSDGSTCVGSTLAPLPADYHQCM